MKIMKNIKLLTSLLLLVSIFLISSCKDDDDPVLTKTQLLTQNTWKYSSGTSSDAFAQSLLAILTGQEYTFKSDKTYSGILLGFPTSGTWDFSADESKLILEKGTSDETSSEIVKLDASNLELKTVDGGVTTTLKYAKK